jgi:hypothetical protein
MVADMGDAPNYDARTSLSEHVVIQVVRSAGRRVPGDEYTAAPTPGSNETGANQSACRNDGVNQRVIDTDDGVIES